MFPLHFYRSLQASSLLGGVARSHAMSVRHAKGDAIAGLGSIQTMNFSCTERNIYLGRPKWYKFDGWLKRRSLLAGFNSFSRYTVMYNAYQLK